MDGRWTRRVFLLAPSLVPCLPPCSFLVAFFPPLDPSASRLASTRALPVFPTYTCLLFPITRLDCFHSCHSIAGDRDVMGAPGPTAVHGTLVPVPWPWCHSQ